MIILNFRNVDKLIFQDVMLSNKFTGLTKSFIDLWKLSQTLPILKESGKSAILNFLNNINENDIKILSEYWEDSVIVDKLDSNLSKNISYELEDFNASDLENIQGYNLFSIARNKNKIHFTFWR